LAQAQLSRRVWQFHHSIPSVSPQSPPEAEYERDRVSLNPYGNLPSPTYPEFIGRKTQLKQLLKFISLNRHLQQLWWRRN
jgi:hypothetical protein